MRKPVSVFLLTLVVLFLSLPVQGQEKTAKELIGRRTLNLNMASTEDRLIDYGREYYGRYYLVITFLPAAFTPV